LLLRMRATQVAKVEKWRGRRWLKTVQNWPRPSGKREKWVSWHE